jgi:hypothetical protein
MRSDYAYLPFLLIAIVLIEFLPGQVLRGAHTAGLRSLLDLMMKKENERSDHAAMDTCVISCSGRRRFVGGGCHFEWTAE